MHSRVIRTRHEIMASLRGKNIVFWFKVKIVLRLRGHYNKSFFLLNHNG